MGESSLEDFVNSVQGGSRLRIEHDYGDGFVRLRTSEAERRQAAQDIRNTESIVLELLRNARDAHARHIFVAVSQEEGKRRISVIDDGEGIPPAMHEIVFEPRVTSKLDTNRMDAWGMHGRGMALFSIRENAEVARVEDSGPMLGCSIYVQTDLSKLKERSDQSTFPSFELDDSGVVHVRGPRNILRTVCEFAIEERSTCSVYVGSPIEIATTLYEYGMSTLSKLDRAFCRDVSELPIVKRIACAGDATDMVSIAGSMGLDMSSRSAHRVMKGEVAGLPEVIERISLKRLDNESRKSLRPGGAVQDARSLKLEKGDMHLLGEAVLGAYRDIAERYYLEAGVEPVVRVVRDRITVTIPVVKHP